LVSLIRWCSLARLARPPANFHDASGVAKCMTGSKPTVVRQPDEQAGCTGVSDEAVVALKARLPKLEIIGP